MKITRFELSLFGINTYIVSDPGTGDCAIIDPGMIIPEERQAIERFIASNHLHPVAVINTHLHIDHAVANEWSKGKFGIAAQAHPEDEFLGKRLEMQAAAFGIDGDFQVPVIDRKLHDGDVIKIGDGSLKVIHVPGHSPGSIALYDAADGFVITGDALFNGSIGRTDLPGGNHAQLLKSISEGLMSLPPDTVVYPGHGPATTIGRELRSNPFLL